MTAYYNENDPNAAAWLRELIVQKLIAPGDVDERDIRDIKPLDLLGYDQCHFFAGIGGWSHALRLAGWPDDKPVWTGSCPCQPFSAAGKGNGFADERHLWPAFFHLIEQCRPGVVFGEQVEAAIKHGWLDLVQADLEGIGYAVGAVGLPAASVGAPHIRARAWFVARSLANAEGRGGNGPLWSNERQEIFEAVGRSAVSELAIAERGGRQEPNVSVRPAQQGQATPIERGASFWCAADWIPCADGKARPVEPGTFPLAYGLPARVGRLRGYGNAITPQVAAEFIIATGL